MLLERTAFERQLADIVATNMPGHGDGLDSKDKPQDKPPAQAPEPQPDGGDKGEERPST